jgi:two-component system cell cycle sensor histidine kinase/response regulator CckA
MTSTRMLYFPNPSQSGATASAERSALWNPSSETLGQVFDLSPDLLCVVDFDGCFRVLNQAWQSALGYSKEELSGTPRVGLMPIEDRAVVLTHDAKIAAGASAVSFETRCRRKDGSYIWLQWNEVALPGMPGILAAARDITKEKDQENEALNSRNDLEAQLQESNAAVVRANSILLAEISHRRHVVKLLCEVQEKYRSIFENAVEGIFQSTPEGTYLSVNPALARIKGYDTPEQLIADMENIGEQSYVDPGRRLEFKQVMEKDGVAMGFEYEAYRKDGQRIWLSMNARAVRDAEGAVRYYEGTVEDITERKRLGDQLRLAQKMEAVGQLAGGIAHDFNNLLSVINGHTELLLGQLGESSSLRWNTEQIHKASGRAAALVRQLLAFSRRQVLKPEVLDLNSVVRDVESMIGRIIGENIVVETVLDKTLGCVRADQSQIEQVIVNLALNARDAMPMGGKLTIQTENVERAEESVCAGGGRVAAGSYVAVTVTDTGIGMDAAIQGHIFEPFFTTKDQGTGYGLGLSTVYGIVKQSGGCIGLRSEMGQGAAFTILLPRTVGSTTALPKPIVKNRSWTGTETVLLVEDDVALRELMMSMLLRLGYKVLEASHGSQALNIARKLGQKIDLLLTDVVMPGISGPQLSHEIAALHPAVKVLLMSGYPESVSGKAVTTSVGMPLLEKPFKQPELARKLREVLEAAAVNSGDVPA